MALSNTLWEPRRELTETAIGLLAVTIAFGADYLFALWLSRFYFGSMHHVFGNDGSTPLWLGMIEGVVLAVIIWLIVLLVHSLGEGICNTLQRNNIHLRPRQRRIR